MAKDSDELQKLKKLLEGKEKKQEDVSADIESTTSLPSANVVVMVKNGNNLFEIPVKDGLQIVWERKGTPGKLTFTAKFEKKLKIVEGNSVTVSVGGKNVFYGFVFTRQFSKDGMVQYTAYDQLRYLKNKDTMVYKKKTAAQVISTIADRFNLNCGKISDTKHRSSAVEDNTTLFDMIQNALDETLDSTGKVYVLYDHAGKLCLTDVANMKVNGCLVDSHTGEDFTYKASIDSNVYNQIKLVYENKNKGSYDLYMVRHEKNINKWGVLQYLEDIDDPDIGKTKAQALLKLYNKVYRTLTISNVIGNKNVRAGSLVPVLLDLGDMKVASYMMVEKVTHKFSNCKYVMDLEVSGGDFSA